MKGDKSLISSDKVYEAIERINSGQKVDFSADALLDSIEKSFQQLDNIHSQNFLNFLVDENDFFGKARNYFERIKSLCTILINSDQLSSKSIGLCSQTKLWIQNYQNYPGIDNFINFLYQNAIDSNSDQPPFLRTISSQCLMEIYYTNPELVKLSYDQLIDASNNILIPTAFPEMAMANKGQTPQMAEFYQKRWWSFSPFENVVFSPNYTAPFPAVPNDPLLLHSAMITNNVPKDTALSLINSPLSQFGIPTVLLGFKDNFAVEGTHLFTPFDSKEQIAAKCQLLPPTIQSIESNTILLEFINQPPDSAIVLAVFSIAMRFGPQDIFAFFQRFFEQTPSFDKHWIRLNGSQAPNIQMTLRCFLSQFPERFASAMILLTSPNPTLSVINEVHDANLVPLVKNVKYNQGSIESEFATKKLEDFLHSDNQMIRDIASALTSISSPDSFSMIPGAVDIKPIATKENQFVVEEVIASTTGKTKTSIKLQVRYTNPNSTIFGVTFTLSNSAYFENDGISSISSMTDCCEVRFDMKPKTAGNCNLQLTCSYTTADGEPIVSPMNDINLTTDAFLSPTDSVEDFEGEESRIVLPIQYDRFVERINDYVFGRNAERLGEQQLKAIVVTPDDKAVLFIAESVNNTTCIKFKAPSLTLLAQIDEFLREVFQFK